MSSALIPLILHQETTSSHTSVRMRTSLSQRKTSPVLRLPLEPGQSRETVMVLGFFQELIPTNMETTRLRTHGPLKSCHPLSSSMLTWMPPLILTLTQSALQPVAPSTSTRRRLSVTRSTMEYQTSVEIMISMTTSLLSQLLKA